MTECTRRVFKIAESVTVMTAVRVRAAVLLCCCTVLLRVATYSVVVVSGVAGTLKVGLLPNKRDLTVLLCDGLDDSRG
jgi:hypothetical protein